MPRASSATSNALQSATGAAEIHAVTSNSMNERIALTDDELLQRITALLASERAGLARLIQYLAEVEERRLHLAAAYSSMFDFCTRRLGLSEGEAFRRLTAARLARRFPAIVPLIEAGSIHLSALVRLRNRLTEENHAELLREASSKNKRELERWLAARFPQPDAPSLIRKLPAPHPPEAGAAPASLELGPRLLAAPPARAPRAPGASSAPVSANRYKIQFTAEEALKNKLERAQHLLSHANPTGDLASVVERAVDLLLAELEKKKLGKAERPRGSGKTKRGAISRAARREAFERDGERCSYVGEAGGVVRQRHSSSSITSSRAHSEEATRAATSGCFVVPTIDSLRNARSGRSSSPIAFTCASKSSARAAPQNRMKNTTSCCVRSPRSGFDRNPRARCSTECGTVGVGLPGTRRSTSSCAKPRSS